MNTLSYPKYGVKHHETEDFLAGSVFALAFLFYTVLVGPMVSLNSYVWLTSLVLFLVIAAWSLVRIKRDTSTWSGMVSFIFGQNSLIIDSSNHMFRENKNTLKERPTLESTEIPYHNIKSLVYKNKEQRLEIYYSQAIVKFYEYDRKTRLPGEFIKEELRRNSTFSFNVSTKDFDYTEFEQKSGLKIKLLWNV